VSTAANVERTRGLIATSAIVLLAWTAFALLSITHFFLGKSVSGDGAAFSDLASHILVFYWGWALLTPLILSAARDFGARMQIGESAARVGWLRVTAVAIVVTLLHALWYIVMVRVAGIEPAARLSVTQLQDYLLRHGGGNLATFAAIVGATLLLDARRRARERERAAGALEARLARADAELLRWQLQPHFLFNTLNTVSTLVLKGETQSADRAIALIARWLRDALTQRADAMVPLAEELTTVQRYVAIEALRFGDALRLDIHADGDALVAAIPALIVQPLVENAIRHGVAVTDEQAPITISTRLRDGRLRIAVRNRDANRDDVQRARLSEVTPVMSLESSGFGLRYVRERLMHFYGGDARLELITDGLDVVATLDVPTDRVRTSAGAAA